MLYIYSISLYIYSLAFYSLLTYVISFPRQTFSQFSIGYFDLKVH